MATMAIDFSQIKAEDLSSPIYRIDLPNMFPLVPQDQTYSFWPKNLTGSKQVTGTFTQTYSPPLEGDDGSQGAFTRDYLVKNWDDTPNGLEPKDGYVWLQAGARFHVSDPVPSYPAETAFASDFSESVHWIMVDGTYWRDGQVGIGWRLPFFAPLPAAYFDATAQWNANIGSRSVSRFDLITGNNTEIPVFLIPRPDEAAPTIDDVVHGTPKIDRVETTGTDFDDFIIGLIDRPNYFHSTIGADQTNASK